MQLSHVWVERASYVRRTRALCFVLVSSITSDLPHAFCKKLHAGALLICVAARRWALLGTQD